MRKRGNHAMAKRTSKIAIAMTMMIATWSSGHAQAGPSMAQWRALVPPAAPPTMPGNTGDGACPAQPASLVEMTHAEGMSGLHKAWICVRQRWGGIVARDALEEAIAAERPAMIRHQRAIAELEVERSRIGWRLHEGEWMPTMAFEALLKGQLGLAARDRSRHQGGVTKGDPDAGMRRATAQALRDGARGQIMTEAEYRAANSPNPGPPDPVTGMPGPPQIPHERLDPELIARAIGYGSQRRLAAPMPLHETMILRTAGRRLPRAHHVQRQPLPLRAGQGQTRSRRLGATCPGSA